MTDNPCRKGCMVKHGFLPPLNTPALTSLWDFLRLDTIEERRLEILRTEGTDALSTYDSVLKFLNNYILVAEGKIAEASLDKELRRMLPIIKKAIDISERVVVGTTNQIALEILHKLEKMARSPRLYSREEKILTLDRLASFWHNGTFNLGQALGIANESLTFVSRTIFRALATSKEQLLEEEKERFNRLKELGISIREDEWQWRTKD